MLELCELHISEFIRRITLALLLPSQEDRQEQTGCNFITVRNEVAKVMFSQACVCPQGGACFRGGACSWGGVWSQGVPATGGVPGPGGGYPSMH